MADMEMDVQTYETQDDTLATAGLLLRAKKNEILKMKHNSIGIKGFSLVELLVIIGIMAIMATVAIPNLVSYIPKYNLGAGARELLSAMQLARMTAIKENSDVKVSLNSGANSLTIVADDGAGTERLIRAYQMPFGIKLVTSPPLPFIDVQFNNRGIPDTNGDVRVINTLSKTRMVRLLASGHSRIQ